MRARFLDYARGPALEVQTCAYVALDQGYVIPFLFEQIYQQADKTVKIVDGFLRYLRSHQRSRLSQRS
ncbi:MAG: four helix bundle protein [Planctomycetes bacterium]|nr:four helix bundle protein [Planctomycetota bacterium]